MSFLLPLRPICRQAPGRLGRCGLHLQVGSRPLQQSVAIPTIYSKSGSASNRFLWVGPIALMASLGLSTAYSKRLYLDSAMPQSNVGTSSPFASAKFDTGMPIQEELPKSDVNVYNLGFGSVCGICSGIFIKKGAKLIAFLLGGAFVLLQYLNTQRIISVNWRALSSRYDSAVSRAAGEDNVTVNKSASGWTDSTAARIWNRSVHFLTADFPSRGTFVAGLLLGLRLG